MLRRDLFTARLMLWFLIVAALACARRRDASVQSDATGAGDSMFVAVINENYYDARVHLVYDGGAPYSLGTVGGNQRTAVRTVPWLPRPLVVEVSLIVGGGTYRSDRIDVARGDVLEIRVPPDLQTSGFFRRVSR